ncbi:phage tail assembly protein [uncultured Campylobacter sp.]|uniref:phage tail assembly protein n=1 Tax=uncultured Campylobacter sp. TaxID=218934 RepID=UPI00262CD6E8|nr:phage tail assembly protein [uncultured Campylobacter sp.]
MRNIKVNLPICGEEIEVFAPSVKTFKAVSAEKTEIEQSIKLCAACANKTPAQIEELDIADFNVLQKTVQGFLDV